MSKFEKSEWAKNKHVQEFVENADIYILERKRMLAILKSFYRYFILNRSEQTVKVLDLGCGNGILTRELLTEELTEDCKIEATLVDGSKEMLKNAQDNLKQYGGMNFVHKTFQDLIDEGSDVQDVMYTDYDFVVSSLAIHHLQTHEKNSLFQFIHDHLKVGGFFLNIETVKAPTDELESWYRALWSEWILENESKMGFHVDYNGGLQASSKGDSQVNKNKSFQYLPEQYKNNPDNHPDSLYEQMDALKRIGFQQVDCYYKYGIFSIYGGMK